MYKAKQDTNILCVRLFLIAITIEYQTMQWRVFVVDRENELRA